MVVGDEFVFDEVYDHDNTVALIVEKIKAVLRKWKIDIKKVSFYIDSASQVKREYRENGLYCIDAKKDVENQIQQVRNRFSRNKLFFLKNCKMHIIEHQGYVWDEKRKIPAPVKSNDHTCNSLQYIFSTYHVSKAIDKEALERQQNSILWMAQNEYKRTSKEAFS